MRKFVKMYFSRQRTKNFHSETVILYEKSEKIAFSKGTVVALLDILPERRKAAGLFRVSLLLIFIWFFWIYNVSLIIKECFDVIYDFHICVIVCLKVN